jgi:hypothetical protein
VQQPYEISILTAIGDSKEITLLISAYPNPATEYLVLNINGFELSNLAYQLCDMQGKVLQSEKITGNQTSIDMSNLALASYILKVAKGDKEVKILKVIKN